MERRSTSRLESNWTGFKNGEIAKKMRFLQGLLLSLGIHLLFFWGSQFLPAPKTVSQRERVEFDVVTRSPARRSGSYVRQTLVPDELLTKDSEASQSFMGEHFQRVKKQTQAANIGKTQNRARLGHAGDDGEGDKTREGRKPQADLFKLKGKSLGDILVRARQDDEGKKQQRRGEDRRTSQNPMNLPQGFSTVGQTLPQEVEVGAFTSLNTDRYLFYSFFKRTEDLIRFTWESTVKEALARTPRSDFEAHLANTWVSVVDIMLKPNGEFHRAILLKSSGIEGFDYAAMDAFAQAKVFPNPPEEMLEEDGFIHLKYNFTVFYQPAPLASGENDERRFR